MTATMEESATAETTLSLRDRFALAAVPAIIATYRDGKLPPNAPAIVALAAFGIADACIEARDNRTALEARLAKDYQARAEPQKE